MKQCVIGIWANNTDGFIEAVPRIYSNNTWTNSVIPYVYDGSAWKAIGKAGTLMIPFITSQGEDFYDSTNKPFLVRSHM